MRTAELPMELALLWRANFIQGGGSVAKFVFKYVKEVIDSQFIKIIVKGSLTAIVIFFLLMLTKLMLSYISKKFGLEKLWIESFIEVFHVIFSFSIFILSCTKDLIQYIKK